MRGSDIRSITMRRTLHRKESVIFYSSFISNLTPPIIRDAVTVSFLPLKISTSNNCENCYLFNWKKRGKRKSENGDEIFDRHLSYT